jgi:hypothetical protein
LTINELELILEYPHILGLLVGKTKLSEIHSQWVHETWTPKTHTTLQGHRGSFKTTILTIIAPIWWLLFHPNDRIAIVGKSFTDASDRLRTIAKIMQTQKIQDIFKYAHGTAPKAITEKAEKLVYNFKTTHTPEGSIDAYGLDTGLTGRHYDKIICDDIVTLKDRLSRAEREKTKQILLEIVTNIIDPDKQVIHIGTPWHKDDAWSLTDTLPEPKKYDVYTTGILTPEEIAVKKKGTTRTLFGANYELKHIVDENKLFKHIKYERWLSTDKNVVGHIDAGFDGTNRTAITFVHKEQNKFYAIGFCFEDNIKNKFDFIVKMYKKYKVGTIAIEDNADKGFVADELTKRGILVQRYNERMNKHLKISTHLYKHWDNIVWDADSDEEYINLILDYDEFAELDDPPDSAASLLKVFFDDNNSSDYLYKL